MLQSILHTAFCLATTIHAQQTTHKWLNKRLVEPTSSNLLEPGDIEALHFLAFLLFSHPPASVYIVIHDIQRSENEDDFPEEQNLP
jgi:hypothetical protein